MCSLLVSILKKEKFVKLAEIQEKLGVSARTLKYDIAYLKKVYPDNLTPHRGRYTGGIEWKE